MLRFVLYCVKLSLYDVNVEGCVHGNVNNIYQTQYARNQVHIMGNYLTVTEYINEHEEQAYTMTLIN